MHHPPLKLSCSKCYEDFPCSHRQWRHTGQCSFVHGYSRSFTFWFTANELDENGFVVDFSSLKPLVKRLKNLSLQWCKKVDGNQRKSSKIQENLRTSKETKKSSKCVRRYRKHTNQKRPHPGFVLSPNGIEHLRK